MRLFAAIYPSAEAVHAWQAFQKKAPPFPLRWMTSDSLHVTVKFLGAVPAEKEAAVADVMRRLAKQASPFEVELTCGGTFPPKGTPAIFWAGLKGDVATLAEIANMASLEFKQIGFPAETKPYRPHMTVARPADKNRPLGRAVAEQYVEWIASLRSSPFLVKEICLVESHLGATGSTYQVRANFSFGG